MSDSLPIIVPDWPAPKNVKSLSTTRQGGESAAPYDSLNLGLHVGDDAQAVTANRKRLLAHLPKEPMWLNQVHGVEVCQQYAGVCDADASVSTQANDVCVVMTADCLPVLFCDAAGTQVAAAHAGWRGLADGVLEQTLAHFESPQSVMAWLGPAIGPDAFEVGQEVKDQFCAWHADCEACFKASTQPGKWLADLYALARLRLKQAGVTQVYGGEFCTFSDEARFFSYRRDGVTGRMASCIWLAQ